MKRLFSVAFITIILVSSYAFGHEIVRNRGRGLWNGIFHKKRISLTQDLSIGVKEGNPNEMFSYIPDVKVDSKGNIYVIDFKNYRIQVFDNHGNFVRTIGGKKGKGPGEFEAPWYLALDKMDHLFVLDRNGVISEFDTVGKFLHSFSTHLVSNFVLVDSKGNLIVNAQGRKNVFYVYTPKGELINSFGNPVELPIKTVSAYKGLKQTQPVRAFLDSSDALYGSLALKYDIMVYKQGKLVREITRAFKIPPPKVYPNGTSVSGYSPLGILVLRDGKLLHFYSCTRGRSKFYMDMFNKEGRFLRTFPVDGWGVCIDKAGEIYFVEMEPFPRVVRYKLSLK